MADRTYTNDERARRAFLLIGGLVGVIEPDVAALLMEGTPGDVQAHVLQLMIDKHLDANDAAVILQFAFDRQADEFRRQARG